MKKTLRRHLLFGSAAIFSVFLAAGCGKKATPGEQAVKEMTSAMEEVTSVRMSLAVDWTPVGESSIAMKTDIEQMKEPMDSHTVLTVTQGRGSTSQELYVIRQKEDLAYSYIKEKDAWSVYEHKPVEEDLGRKILLTSGSEWELGEETEINGIPCMVITGEITSKNMVEVIKASGLRASAVEANAKGIVTLYQDSRTKLPLSVTIDFGMLTDMENFLISCVYDGFNDLDAIVLPEEAKKAKPL
ncbi:MAG: hypothetical protein HFI65_00245 [Lachnospiraceae bacterium]|nr:hypothetical protein [Lachnospiraceae bacterium]